jgi:rubrerythrin
MPELKNSKTLENLEYAFAGESKANAKYQFFASRAKKDGFEQIAEIFTVTAGNELEHAEQWYKLIVGGIGATPENLQIAADGEHEEWAEMYKAFAETAQAEGFDAIAKRFALVGAIEKEHEERYLKLLKNIEDGKVFTRDGQPVWVCRKCGHVHVGAAAPQACPVCSHTQAYFELKAENY